MMETKTCSANQTKLALSPPAKFCQKNFRKHLNFSLKPAWLVFIWKISLSTFKWIPMWQGSDDYQAFYKFSFWAKSQRAVRGSRKRIWKLWLCLIQYAWLSWRSKLLVTKFKIELITGTGSCHTDETWSETSVSQSFNSSSPRRFFSHWESRRSGKHRSPLTQIRHPAK